MESWKEMGYLDKAAFFTFAFGLPGMAAAFILGKLVGQDSLIGWILVIWFASPLLWLLCVWAAGSRYEFIQTCGFVCGMSFFGGLLNFDEELALYGPIFGFIGTLLLAVFGKPAAFLLNWGRPTYARWWY
ncbi:MAG: hypothetical protein R3D89_11815 [Sphingomonadaceae bacterium]